MLLRLERFGQLSNFASSYFCEMVCTKCFYRTIIDNLIGSTVGGGAMEDMRYYAYGFPFKESGGVGDTMDLLSREAGPSKIKTMGLL